MTPIYEIQVRGKKGSATLKAIVDTGFEGQLCLPIDTAVELGLELVGKVHVTLADGAQKPELLFAAEVTFLGRTMEVSVLLTQSDEILIGTDLLADCRLVVDFPTGKVRVSRKGK